MDDTSENFDFHTNIHICHNELCREHLKYIALLLLSQADTLNSVILYIRLDAVRLGIDNMLFGDQSFDT